MCSSIYQLSGRHFGSRIQWVWWCHGTSVSLLMVVCCWPRMSRSVSTSLMWLLVFVLIGVLLLISVLPCASLITVSLWLVPIVRWSRFLSMLIKHSLETSMRIRLRRSLVCALNGEIWWIDRLEFVEDLLPQVPEENEGEHEQESCDQEPIVLLAFCWWWK